MKNALEWTLIIGLIAVSGTILLFPSANSEATISPTLFQLNTTTDQNTLTTLDTFGTNIRFDMLVTDQFFSPLSGVLIGIIPSYNPTKIGSVISTPQGNASYTDTHVPPGVHKYRLIGSKVGYQNGYMEKNIVIPSGHLVNVEVFDSAGNPVPDAFLVVNGEEKKRTNPNGKVNLNFFSGTYVLQAKTNNGYICESKTITITTPQSVRFSCPVGNLVVRVFSPDYAPIANAYIQLDQQPSQLTNASGAHFFKNQAFGNHLVTIFLKIKETPETQPKEFFTQTTVNLSEDLVLKEFQLAPNSIQVLDTSTEMLVLSVDSNQSKRLPNDISTENAIVIKGKMNINQSQETPITDPLHSDTCYKKYLLTGEWPTTECSATNTIWIGTDSITQTIKTNPFAYTCGDQKCSQNLGVILTQYIVPPLKEFFTGTDGGRYFRISYTEKGKGQDLEACLNKLGIAKDEIIQHINNKILIPHTPIEKYNQHIGQYRENGLDCSVFYESVAFKESGGTKGCEKSCEPPEKYIRNPPISYPSFIPTEHLDDWVERIIRHNNVENGWPTLDRFKPFSDIGIIIVEGAGVAAGALILWEATKPVRCLLAAFLAPETIGGSVVLCVS